MTRNPSSSKTARAPFVTARYMFATSRRGWALCLLIAIAFLLTYTVPTLMMLPNIASDLESHIASIVGSEHEVQIIAEDAQKSAAGAAAEVAADISKTAVVVSMIAAVFAGCYSLLFLQNKTSSAFYHSLPERRSGHFITALFTSFAAYIAAFLINFAITVVVFSVYGFMSVASFTVLILGFLNALFFFVAMLSVTFLAGTLTGSLVMHVIITGLFTFILQILFGAVTILLSEGTEFFQPSSLYDIAILRLMSPFIAGVDAISGDGAPAYSYIVTAIMMLLSFALSYVAYKNRPIERSGSSIVYRRVGEALKYIVMAPSAVLLGYMFEEIVDSVAWGVFGFIIGLLLSFMLCNTALNRTAKAMFRGMRGLCVSAVCVAAVSVMLSTGIFGTLDYTVPSHAERIYVSVSGMQYAVDTEEKDEIDAIIKEIDSMVSKLKADGHGGVNYPYSAKNSYVNVLYNEPGDISLRYNYPTVPYEYLRGLIDLMADINEEKTSAYMSTFKADDLELSNIMLPGSFVLANATDIENYSGQSIDSFSDADFYAYFTVRDCQELTDEIKEIFNDFKPVDETSIGKIRIEGKSRYSAQMFAYDNSNGYYYDGRSFYSPITYPQLLKLLILLNDNELIGEKIFFGDATDTIEFRTADESVVAAVKVEDLLSLSYDEYIDLIADQVTRIVVHDIDGNDMTFTDKNDIHKILPTLEAMNVYAWTDRTVHTDSGYYVEVYMMCHDGKYTYVDGDIVYEGAASTAEEVDHYIGENVLETWFLEGKAPDIVK